MSINGWLQIILYFLVILAVTKPLGIYMFRVFEGEPQPLPRFFGPIERGLYRLCGVDPREQQTWTQYTLALLLFSAITLLVTYAIERLQQLLPLNPQHFDPVPPDLAFNTAASFTTNTNWQAYSGESTMSYLTQMAGLAWHNFISAAAGIAVALALARGLTYHLRPGDAKTIGNFWIDLIRCTVYVLLPICIPVALVLVSQGIIQNFSPYVDLTTVEGAKQTLALGPVASQEVIKELGTNGGGFFNANSAHPFENPTPWSNFWAMFLIFAIPSGLVWMFGKMVGNVKHGWAVWTAMFVLFFGGVSTIYWAEARGNVLLAGTDQKTSLTQPGGNMEGKEVRFGIANSALWATVTTDTSCGAINSWHDSFTPLGGMVPLANIMLSEVVFGGVGSGMYGMLIYIVLAVFIAGLMVGRTPEDLGKKIEAYDVKMAMLVVLVFPLVILGFSAISVIAGFGTPSILNPGPHGLSEIIYSFTSQAGNNGSAFAGLTTNTLWYNTAGAITMLVGRFLMIIPALAIAGNLAGKKYVPPSLGTFPVTTPLFTMLLIGVILIVGALTFFPAISLGPILEHLLMMAGKTF